MMANIVECNLHSLSLSVTSLTCFQSSDLVDVLNAYFKANDSGSSSLTETSTSLEFLIFSGQLNPFLLDNACILSSYS